MFSDTHMRLPRCVLLRPAHTMTSHHILAESGVTYLPGIGPIELRREQNPKVAGPSVADFQWDQLRGAWQPVGKPRDR